MIMMIIKEKIIAKCQNCLLTQTFRVYNPSSVRKNKHTCLLSHLIYNVLIISLNCIEYFFLRVDIVKRPEHLVEYGAI